MLEEREETELDALSQGLYSLEEQEEELLQEAEGERKELKELEEYIKWDV